MSYPRRFGVFVPPVSLVTTIVATYFAKPLLEVWSPQHWLPLLVVVALALWGISYFVCHALYILFLRFAAKSTFRSSLTRRWHEVITSNDSSAPLTAEDYFEKVAELQVRISMPEIVRDAVKQVVEEHKATCARLQRALDQYASGNTLEAFVSVLGNQWRRPAPVTTATPMVIDDPVHGCVTLDEVLSSVVSQPIVQRLGRVRQLSFSYTHFPSANHSRLSHVLGVAQNVENALMGVFARGVCYEEGASHPFPLPGEILAVRDKIIQRAKLLAILHDLGHGPFGHALDNYVGYVNKYQATPNPDKIYSQLYVDRHLSGPLEQLGFDPKELIRILDPKSRADLTGFDALIGDLIDSSMDMDRMDYLLRDAHMTGLSMGFTNADALIQFIRPLRVGGTYLLAYDDRGVEYMEHLLYAREAMYRSCYEHPPQTSSGAAF